MSSEHNDRRRRRWWARSTGPSPSPRTSCTRSPRSCCWRGPSPCWARSATTSSTSSTRGSPPPSPTPSTGCCWCSSCWSCWPRCGRPWSSTGWWRSRSSWPGSSPPSRRSSSSAWRRPEFVGKEGDGFRHAMTGIGVLGGIVLLLAVATFLVRRKEREPEEEEKGSTGERLAEPDGSERGPTAAAAGGGPGRGRGQVDGALKPSLVWARLGKRASNGLGARAMPRSSMWWKKRACQLLLGVGQAREQGLERARGPGRRPGRAAGGRSGRSGRRRPAWPRRSRGAASSAKNRPMSGPTTGTCTGRPASVITVVRPAASSAARPASWT